MEQPTHGEKVWSDWEGSPTQPPDPAARWSVFVPLSLSFTLSLSRFLGVRPYHTSASGLHSKMLLVNGLICSQGKSAT